MLYINTSKIKNAMNQLQLKVWRYINSLPKYSLDGTIDFNYKDVCLILNITVQELVHTLRLFEQNGLIYGNGITNDSCTCWIKTF